MSSSSHPRSVSLMPITLLDVVVCIAAALLVCQMRSWQNRKAGPEQPPGPRGLPLVGNLFDIPANAAWTTYREWSRKYDSDLIRMNILGHNFVVVNAMGPATDLLEKRSSIYSDRGATTMLNVLCEFDWNVAFMRYGTRWRDQRRAFHLNFNADGVKKFHSIFETSTHAFLRSLLQPGADVMTELRHLAGQEIMRTSYGIDVLRWNDPYIDAAEHSLSAISATVNAGSYLVDTLPMLKYVPEWFPGAKFQKEAKTWARSVFKMREEPWNAVKSRLAQGEVPDCAATSLVEALANDPKGIDYTEDAVKDALGSMYVGGSDTTVSALGSFFLAMVLWPDIQEKARRAVDDVCAGRLPNYSDMPDIPYIDALIKESLRWHPVVPLNVPHRVTTDDVYAGYFIPKDTLVIANNWAILHDEDAYPDPFTFNPDRFLKDGQIDPDVQDPTTACFGLGRRICPGRFWAYEAMWITIATTLATVTITSAKGADGQPVMPKGEYKEEFLCAPIPFACDIQARSTEHLALLERRETLH